MLLNVFLVYIINNVQATEVYAFQLLNCLYACNPVEVLLPYLTVIFNLLLQRMQEAMKEGKTARYCRLFLHSMCVFSAVYGPHVMCSTLETITPGLVGMIVMNIWSFNRAKCATSDDVDATQMVVGATRLLVESTVVTQKPEIWGSLLKSVVVLVDQSPSKGNLSSSAADDILLGDEDGAGEGGPEFDSAYSKLAYAYIPQVDPCADVSAQNAPLYFGKHLGAFLHSSSGAQYASLIPQLVDSAETTVLYNLIQQSGN